MSPKNYYSSYLWQLRNLFWLKDYSIFFLYDYLCPPSYSSTQDSLFGRTFYVFISGFLGSEPTDYTLDPIFYY